MSDPLIVEPPHTCLPNVPERIYVTKLAVDPVSRQQLFDWVIQAAKLGRSDGIQRTVSYLNVHVANLAAKDERLTEFINQCCDLVYCDGKGIGWGARLQDLPDPPRMTAADWLPELLEAFRDSKLRVFVVAGKPGVAEQAVENIKQQTGPLGEIETHDGYLNPEKTERLLDRISEFQPDIVLVGMGSPIQEHWVLEYRHAIKASVVWTLGATFDYFTDEQERGPQWLRDAGHEWAARLLADPMRLWQRYLIGNPRFLIRALLTGKNKQDSRGKTD